MDGGLEARGVRILTTKSLGIETTTTTTGAARETTSTTTTKTTTTESDHLLGCVFGVKSEKPEDRILLVHSQKDHSNHSNQWKAYWLFTLIMRIKWDGWEEVLRGTEFIQYCVWSMDGWMDGRTDGCWGESSEKRARRQTVIGMLVCEDWFNKENWLNKKVAARLSLGDKKCYLNCTWVNGQHSRHVYGAAVHMDCG